MGGVLLQMHQERVPAGRALFIDAAAGHTVAMKTNVLSALILLFAAGSAQAAIYTWVDPQGVRHYSDNASTPTARQAQLPGLQAADGNADALRELQAQADSAAADTSANTGDPRAVVFTQPSDGQTLRNTQAQVSVALTIGGTSALKDGEQITYYLDGKPIPDMPTTQTRLTLAQVRRGTHTISAALSYRGREIKRTTPLTFHMQPPSAISPLSTGQTGSDQDDGQVPGAAVAPSAGNATGVMAAPRLGSSTAGAPGS